MNTLVDPSNRATIARNISISATPAPLQAPAPIIPKLIVPTPTPAQTQQASPRAQVPTSTLTPIPESSGHGSSCGDDVRFNKYRTMVKNKSPVGIVRLQMKKDGFSPTEIDACFGASPTAAPSKPTLSPAPIASDLPAMSPPPIAPAAGDEDTYKKYRTMLKLNLPEGAVRQKMRTDGISPTIIDIFITSGGTVPPPPSAPAAAQASVTPPVPPPAESAEDPMKKYRTMLKLNLPEGAIRQKMKVDGFSFSVIDAFIKTNGAITTPAAVVVDDKLKEAVAHPVLHPHNSTPIAPKQQPLPQAALEAHIPDHIDAYPLHQAPALSSSDKTSLPDEDDDLSDDEGLQSMTAVRSVQTASPLPLPRPRRKADGRSPITASKSDYNKANAAFFAGIVEVCIYGSPSIYVH